MSEHDEWTEGLKDFMQEEDAADGDAVIDLNTATEQDLQQLPGIGPALATRIVDYRTEMGGFQEPSDVVAVPGVSKAMYAEIADRLVASSIQSPEAGAEAAGTEELPVEAFAPLKEADGGEEPEFPEEEVPAAVAEPEVEEMEEESASGVEEVEILAAEAAADGAELEVEEMEEEVAAGVEEVEILEAEAFEPEVVEEPAAPIKEPQRPAPAYAPPPRQSGHWGRLILAGLLSIALGALLVLVVLYAVNGTLDFRTASSRELQREAFRLEGEIGALQADLDQMQNRLGAMEDLAAQLNDVQTDLAWLQKDVSDLQAGVASLTNGLTGLQETQKELAEGQREVGQAILGLEDRMGGAEEQIAELQRVTAELAGNVVALQEELAALRLSAERFDAFLGGLRQLLNESMGAPTRTPWVTPYPSPTPWGTWTPQPEATAVPLATLTPKP